MSVADQIEDAITQLAILEIELRTVSPACSKILQDCLDEFELELYEARENDL